MFTPARTASAHGFCLVPGDEMAVRVGTVAQFPDRVVIRDDEAFEPPFLAEHVAQQPFAGVRRHAVNFIVGRHHTDGARLLDGFFERIQKGFAQQARRRR